MLKKKWLLSVIVYFLWGNASASALFFQQGVISPFNIKQPINCQHYERKENIILVNPSCILEGKLPLLELQDRIDAVWTSIDHVGSGYLSNTSFAVYTSDHISLFQNEKLFPLSRTNRSYLLDIQKKGGKAELPLSSFAPYAEQSLSYFISDKDISNLKPCTRTNYLLAFENLDGKVIKSGDYFNFNHYLFGLRGYCRGQGNSDLKFYGGVCGASSQLFRASLTSPIVNIPLRWGHNEWFSAYYGDRVEGDDAAVYETSKQLILHNNSAYDIFIKTFQQDQKTYLILVTEKEAVKNLRVELQKVYDTPLQVKLIKQVYQKQISPKITPFPQIPFSQSWETRETIQTLHSELFISHYLDINPELR